VEQAEPGCARQFHHCCGSRALDTNPAKRDHRTGTARRGAVMNGKAFSSGLLRSAHRELQIVALVILGAAMLSGGSALALGMF